jgi:hypothetical protein
LIWSKVFETLKANNAASRTVAFPEVPHGFSIRADISEGGLVEDEVNRFYQETVRYFAEHL